MTAYTVPRVTELDALRGFALLGILLMNIEYFAGRPFATMAMGLDQTLHGTDGMVAWFVMAFVQRKFYVLFALLFGIGFALMAERDGKDFPGAHLRRCLGLLAIGLAHAWLVWAGDILVSYALLAMLLPLFRRFRVSSLLTIAALCWSLPLLLLWMSLLLAAASPGQGEDAGSALETVLAAVQQASLEAQRVYAGDSYTEVLAQRRHDLASMVRSFPYYAPQLLAMFLLGMALVRAHIITCLTHHRRGIRSAAAAGLLIGVPLAAFAMQSGAADSLFELDLDQMGARTAMSAANLLLALGYAAAIVSLALSPRLAWLVRWMAPAGRLSLSNYLLQSLICTSIFYGYGLGYWATLSRTAEAVLALLIWLMLVLASARYGRYAELGLAEALLRRITYPRRQRPEARAPGDSSEIMRQGRTAPAHPSKSDARR